MSHFLSHLGNLVNDPSTALFHELRLRIFSGSRDAEEATRAPTTSTTTRVDVKSIQVSDAACSTSSSFSVRRGKRPESHSISMQAGIGLDKRRQIGVQSQSSAALGKRHKSTSIQPALHLDRSTDAAVQVMTKDAQTEPLKLKICKKHRDAVLSLRHFPQGRNIINKSNSCVFAQLKSSISKVLNSLKLEKIQSIPLYVATDEDVFKLYRCASLDRNVERETKRPTKRKTRNPVKIYALNTV